MDKLEPHNTTAKTHQLKLTLNGGVDGGVRVEGDRNDRRVVD